MRSEIPLTRYQAFTLVELMVALALSLFLIGALQLMFSSARSSADQAEQLSRLQENIRFASDLIVRDVRNAGFRDDPDASFTLGQELSTAYAVISQSGDELTIRYAGRGSCSEPFDEVRLVANRYFVNNQGHLACQGNTAGGSVADGTTNPLVGGFSSISFSKICPDEAVDCGCFYNSIDLGGVEDACLGVGITMQFQEVDGISRSIHLTASFRNVILDKLLKDSL